MRALLNRSTFKGKTWGWRVNLLKHGFLLKTLFCICDLYMIKLDILCDFLAEIQNQQISGFSVLPNFSILNNNFCHPNNLKDNGDIYRIHDNLMYI